MMVLRPKCEVGGGDGKRALGKRALDVHVMSNKLYDCVRRAANATEYCMWCCMNEIMNAWRHGLGVYMHGLGVYRYW